MSNTIQIGGNGLYEGYEAVLENANKVKETVEEVKGGMPKGISFKIQKNKYLYLQWKHPFTGSRNPKECNVPFSPEGVYQAREKAWKIKQALNRFETVSEFDEWYKKEILEINEIENDLKTYREIFQEIEDEYFKGRNKFTKRPRSKDIGNDKDS